MGLRRGADQGGRIVCGMKGMGIGAGGGVLWGELKEKDISAAKILGLIAVPASFLFSIVVCCLPLAPLMQL